MRNPKIIGNFIRKVLILFGLLVSLAEVLYASEILLGLLSTRVAHAVIGKNLTIVVSHLKMYLSLPRENARASGDALSFSPLPPTHSRLLSRAALA